MTQKQKKKEILKYIFFVITFVIVLALVVLIIRFIDKIDEKNSGEDAFIYISSSPAKDDEEEDIGVVPTTPDEQPVNLSGHNLD